MSLRGDRGGIATLTMNRMLSLPSSGQGCTKIPYVPQTVWVHVLMEYRSYSLSRN